jgi:ubiquinone/menaquinone biosynthesis C-methylase UbiE
MEGSMTANALHKDDIPATAPSDTRFYGSIPDIYERFLVPLIFQFYATDLAQRIAATRPQRILETAAGTGVVTRALAAALPKAQLIATDLNQPMLDHAETLHGAASRVDWRQADALALPFGDASFDAAVCQFGAMFFPDKVKAYREARRVLKPGGHFIFNVWDEISANEFADVVTQALADVFPRDPPQFLARTPHGYHDIGRIRSELTAAGFATISVDGVDARSKASSPRHPAIAYCQGTPLRSEIEARDGSRLQEATERAAAALAHRFGNSAIDGRIRAFVITAKRP